MFVWRAGEAGAEEIQPPTDLFYGANPASVRDPFGHVWVLLVNRNQLPGPWSLKPPLRGNGAC